MWDSGYLSSRILTLNISVISVDDETPRLVNTSFTTTFTEEGNATNLLNSTVTILDDDNCPEHQMVSQIRVRVTSFTTGEDFLLDGVGQEIYYNETWNQYGLFQFAPQLNASGYGNWTAGLLDALYINYTCDRVQYPGCYENFLRSIQYNNTANEPSVPYHNIHIEVSTTHLIS